MTLMAGHKILQYLVLALSHIHNRTHFQARASVSKFGESPGDYFTRTIHAGNVGVVGIDSVAYYHDMALTLPRLSDTLGEMA